MQISGTSSDFTIGSAADNDLQVSIPNVSRHHARLSRGHNGIVLEDLGSTNGTFIEGKRVTRSVVRPGQTVQLSLHYKLEWDHPALRQWLAKPEANAEPRYAPPRVSPPLRPAEHPPVVRSPYSSPPPPAQTSKKVPVEEPKQVIIHQASDGARCPKCSSTSIHADKKGYSAGSGCCGYLTCGPLGFLCGQVGANKIRVTCLKCGYSWKP